MSTGSIERSVRELIARAKLDYQIDVATRDYQFAEAKLLRKCLRTRIAALLAAGELPDLREKIVAAFPDDIDAGIDYFLDAALKADDAANSLHWSWANALAQRS
ncbi:hypothetical protein FHW12_003142 [Dokdonella fugitiva]|uniref:Uncharacterized protein n=1 Tax=Dokdonella fugitiva TaxID=328517 RepID=A0A839F2U5_9GAMM|nr:hypothetical protein [Dokdonella fugitiva]MBA8888906.1 hypothetical protein [Dokdonella fugitiva]